MMPDAMECLKVEEPATRASSPFPNSDVKGGDSCFGLHFDFIIFCLCLFVCRFLTFNSFILRRLFYFYLIFFLRFHYFLLTVSCLIYF